jgi:chromosome segregation ATPase
LYLDDEPVSVGKAVAFYRECQSKGKIVVGLPFVFQRVAEEKVAESIRREYDQQIQTLQSYIEDDKAKLEGYQSEFRKVDARLEKLKAEMEECRKEGSRLLGEINLLRDSTNPVRTSKIGLLESERDEAMAAATSDTDSVMENDRLPMSEVYGLLARLSEGDAGEKGAA